MKHYKNITHFENRRRLNKLIKFRDDVLLYFSESEFNRREDRVIEGKGAKTARYEINQSLIEIKKIVLAAEIDIIIIRQPIRKEIDLFLNLFYFYELDLVPQDMTDYLERAIGVYESDRSKSIIRTFNIFWWGLQGLNWVSYIPFKALRAAGFDAAKAERSVWGRFVKLIFLVIPVIAALFEISAHMNWLDEIKRALGVSS